MFGLLSVLRIVIMINGVRILIIFKQWLDHWLLSKNSLFYQMIWGLIGVGLIGVGVIGVGVIIVIVGLIMVINSKKNNQLIV